MALIGVNFAIVPVPFWLQPRQALKYLRYVDRLIIPLSCFPVLRRLLSFPCGTPTGLRFAFVLLWLYYSIVMYITQLTL